MTKPSFQDYGTYDESAHRDLWDGVVGYWAPCLGPTGTRLFDVSRFGNWGTLTNMDAATDWVIDGGQYALDFDGTNDYVASTSLKFPQMGSLITASMWIKWLSTQTDFRIPFMIGVDAIGGNRGYFLWRSNAGFVRSEFGSSTGAAIAPATTGNSVWVHVVGQYDGATNKLFLNGIESASVSYSAANFDQTGRLVLGSYFGGGVYTGFTNCQIAEVVIWNKPITANGIQTLYHLGRGGMLERRRRRRFYSVQADVVRSYLFVNRGQLIGGGTL